MSIYSLYYNTGGTGPGGAPRTAKIVRTPASTSAAPVTYGANGELDPNHRFGNPANFFYDNSHSRFYVVECRSNMGLTGSTPTFLHWYSDHVPEIHHSLDLGFEVYQSDFDSVTGRIFMTRPAATNGPTVANVAVFNTTTNSLEASWASPVGQVPVKIFVDEVHRRLWVFNFTPGTNTGNNAPATPVGDTQLFNLDTGALVTTFTTPRGLCAGSFGTGTDGSQICANTSTTTGRVFLYNYGQLGLVGGSGTDTLDVRDAYTGALISQVGAPAGYSITLPGGSASWVYSAASNKVILVVSVGGNIDFRLTSFNGSTLAFDGNYVDINASLSGTSLAGDLGTGTDLRVDPSTNGSVVFLRFRANVSSLVTVDATTLAVTGSAIGVIGTDPSPFSMTSTSGFFFGPDSLNPEPPPNPNTPPPAPPRPPPTTPPSTPWTGAMGLFFGGDGLLHNLNDWSIPPAAFDPNSANTFSGSPIYDSAQRRLIWSESNSNPPAVCWFDAPASVRHHLVIPDGQYFAGMMLDESTGRLFAATQTYSGTISSIQIIDTASMTVWYSWPAPAGMNGILGLDETHRRLWLRIDNVDRNVALLDLDTGSVVAVAFVDFGSSAAATGVYFSTSTNKAFVYGKGLNNLNIYNGTVSGSQDGIQIHDALDGHYIKTVGQYGTMPNSWTIADPNSIPAYQLVYNSITNKLIFVGMQTPDNANNLKGLIAFDDAAETFEYLPFNWNEASAGNGNTETYPISMSNGPVIDQTTGAIYVGGSHNSLTGLQRVFRVITPAVSFAASSWVDHTEPRSADAYANTAMYLTLMPYTFALHTPAPTASATSDTEVTASWTPGLINGNPAASYAIKASNGAQQTVSGSATSVTFSGLITGQLYTFTIHWIDASGGTTSESPPSNSARPIGTIGPLTTALYAADGTSVTVYAKNGDKFAGVNLELDPAKPYTSPLAVVHDSVHGRVYVFCGTGDVHWYDTVTKAHASTTIGTNPQGIGQYIAFDPTTNKIFIANADIAGGLPVFDTVTNAITSTLPTAGHAVADVKVDVVHRRLWAMCTSGVVGQNIVYIFNLDTLALVNTLTGYSDAAVFGWCSDPGNPRVFTLQAASPVGGPQSPGIDVRDALTGAITSSFSVSVGPDFFWLFDFGFLNSTGGVLLTYSAARNLIYGVGNAPNDGVPLLIIVNPDTLAKSFIPFFSDTAIYVDELSSSMYSCQPGAPSFFRSYADPANGKTSETE